MSLLPELDGDVVRTWKNPNVDAVLEFIATLGGDIGGAALDEMDDTLECVYERDRVAMSFHVDDLRQFSLGLAVAFRGDLRDLEEHLAGCDSTSRLPDIVRDAERASASTFAPGTEKLTVGPCLDRWPVGDDVTVVVLGTTSWMCAELHGVPVRHG